MGNGLNRAREASCEPVWRCEDCNWPWPLGGRPPAGAECDNCGGELVVTAPQKEG